MSTQSERLFLKKSYEHLYIIDTLKKYFSELQIDTVKTSTDFTLTVRFCVLHRV